MGVLEHLNVLVGLLVVNGSGLVLERSARHRIPKRVVVSLDQVEHG